MTQESDEVEVEPAVTPTPQEIEKVVKWAQAVRENQPVVSPMEVGEFEKGRERLEMDKNIASEYVQSFQREELVSVLGAFPKFGAAVKEKIVIMADAQGGILQVVKSLNKTRISTGWLAVTIVMVAVIGLIGFRPELLTNVGVYFEDQTNQIFFVVVLGIIAAIVYWLMRRRRRNFYG